MKRNAVFFKIVFLAFLIFGVLFLSCDQEPLFWDIAYDYPPIPPLIGGSPTKMVRISSGLLGNKLYVSNRKRIWAYDIGGDTWGSFAPPGETIMDLAAEGSNLYALDENGTLNVHNGTNWSNVTPAGLSGTIECIFGEGSNLFLGVRNGGSDSKTMYDIYQYGNPAPLVPNTAKLTGIAVSGTTYYFGTLEAGLIKYSGGSSSLLGTASEVGGMVRDGTYVYAATDKGIQYFDISNDTLGETIYYDAAFSSAIAIWSHKSQKLLLVGLRSPSGTFRFGYREIALNSGGIPQPGLLIPGRDDPTSVDSDSSYISAIGKHAINYVWVGGSTPHSGDNDDRPIIFASTAKDGLWSYRARDDGTAQWNGER